MTERTIDVVQVGSASRDLTTDDPRGWRLGGGASYSALMTARLGLRAAAIVGVDRDAAEAHEFDLLRTAGVELMLVRLAEGPVFRNLEIASGRRQICVARGEQLPVVAVPPEWRAASAWSLVPVAGELADAWATVIPGTAFVGLGWQGLLRDLVAGHEVIRRPPSASPFLARADLVGVSRDDLAPGTPVRELTRWLERGAKLVVTDGPAGGTLSQRGRDGRSRTRRYAAALADRELDPTGAGDVFLAALLASMVRPDAISPAVRRGLAASLRLAATAASFVVEAPGLLGVPDRASVLARLGVSERSQAVRRSTA
jgi:sugar/nucleoside kinase (ribokinase family)